MKRLLTAVFLVLLSFSSLWAASGDTLIVFMVNSQDAPTQNSFATLDVRSGASPTMMLDFSSATGETEYATFPAIMPKHYAGGGVDVVIYFSMGTVTSGSVVWGTDFEGMGPNSGATGFTNAINYAGVSVQGIAQDVGSVTISHSSGADMDDVSGTSLFRLMILRDPNGNQTCGACNDDAAGDAELRAIAIIEQ